MQPQAARFEASAALAGADSRSLALLTLRVSLRLPHLSRHSNPYRPDALYGPASFEKSCEI